MSAVQNSQSQILWKLAEEKAQESPLPEIFLRQNFNSIIYRLQQTHKTKVESSIKDKTWEQISKPRIAILKQKIAEMLFSHCKEIFDLQNKKSIEDLQIRRSISQAAKKMSDGMAKEVITLLRKERLHIPKIGEGLRKITASELRGSQPNKAVIIQMIKLWKDHSQEKPSKHALKNSQLQIKRLNRLLDNLK